MRLTNATVAMYARLQPTIMLGLILGFASCTASTGPTGDTVEGVGHHAAGEVSPASSRETPTATPISSAKVRVSRPQYPPPKRIKLEFAEAYRDSSSPKVREEVTRLLRAILQEAGINLTTTERVDATLSVYLRGSASGGNYQPTRNEPGAGRLSGYHYTGASIEGTVQLSLGTNVVWEKAFSGSVPVKTTLDQERRTSADAPYNIAIWQEGSVLTTLYDFVADTYGFGPLVRAFAHVPGGVEGSQIPHEALYLVRRGGVATEALIAGLADKRSVVRKWAAHALGEMRAAPAVGALSRSLTDPSPQVREYAAYSLFLLRDESSADALLLAARKDSNPRVRMAAINALSELADPRIPEVIVLGLNHPDSLVRGTAALAAGQRGVASAEKRLIILLNDADDTVRWRAAEALGKLGSRTAIPRLIDTLADPVPYVAGAAHDSLKEITRQELPRDKQAWRAWWAAQK